MSECECLAYDLDGEPVELQNKLVTARKQYTCPACGDAIEIGLQYRLLKQLDEGCISTYKYHDCCYQLLVAVAAHYLTGWWWNCSFQGCIGGWADINNQKIIDLIDQVHESMNRAGLEDSP